MSRLKLGEYALPAFPVPSEHTIESWLREQSREGLAKRLEKAPLAPGQEPRGLRRAPGDRARRHPQDGLPGLLPDRRGLHQLGQGPRHSGRPGPRFGRRLAGRLGAGHHRPRPAALRPAVRAVPQPRTRVDARLRHRLLHGPPRRGHRLRGREVRPRPRQPDHHLRHDGGEGRGARYRPRARPSVRLRRQHRQAHPDDAGHLPGRCAGRIGGREEEPDAGLDRADRALPQRRRRARPARPRAQPRGPHPQRRQARRRRGDRAIAAAATSARCSPNTTARAAARVRSRSSTRTTSRRSAW